MSASNSNRNNAVAQRNENAESPTVQPRQPRSLEGLLRFAMEATQAEDAPGNAHQGPMDEERRQFLIEAMASITVDFTEGLKNSIEVLTNTERMHSIQFEAELPPEVQKAFTVLLDVIDNMDVANDFYKLGGFAVFPIAYGTDNEKVRMYASSILAGLCQNNPFCQAKALESGLIGLLLRLAIAERGDALIKHIYALSCCCREYEPACRELVSRSGCQTLADLLGAPELAVRTKVAFLIRYLCHHNCDAKEMFIKMNIVCSISVQLRSGHNQNTEHFLSVLVALLEGLDARVLRQFQDPHIQLKRLLEDHLKRPELADDTYCEEKEYCELILSRAFCESPIMGHDEEVADR